MSTQAAPPVPTPVVITPHLALDLRLRYLESLVSSAPATSEVSIARRASHIEASLGKILEAPGSTDAVRRFVQNYESNSPLLSVAPVALNPPESQDMSIMAKVSLILEAENEIKTLEKELREMDALCERDVVEMGRLPEHEGLKAPLAVLEKDTKPIAAAYETLEDRTTVLLQEYNSYITNLSELFVSWNDLITEAEEAVSKLEKENNQHLDIS